MKHNNSYIYPKTVRTDIDGKRHYDIDGGKWKLPSVTTILSATQSAEKRESVTLYYPGLYAGQTDLVGLHQNELAIIDFKQTNKPKRREWIEDYCLQLAAYTMAHNYVYKTGISKGVIMMCSKDNFYQEFVIQGLEMKKYMHQWLKRIDEYYEELRGKD